MVDCLPRLHSLDQALPGLSLTVLMPASALLFQRETLEAILPDRFHIRWMPDAGWLQCTHVYWASLVSGRCMGRLPDDYYRSIREPLFRRFDLPDGMPRRERLYLSRRGARHRRVLNEDELLRFLAAYGFREFMVGEMCFRDEVALFQRAEIILGPHGAALAGAFFSVEIDLVVLYPSRVPPNYFHTLAAGLGQRHHFVCHDAAEEDSDFNVDLVGLRKVLEDELHLRRSH
jgi:capsular polysaccharide biosynthesis protein